MMVVGVKGRGTKSSDYMAGLLESLRRARGGRGGRRLGGGRVRGSCWIRLECMG
jgi:hypothetical protein